MVEKTGRGGGYEVCAGALDGRGASTGAPWEGRGWNWEAGISIKSEAADEAVLWRGPECAEGWCAAGRGAIWKCSGRRWPGLGLLNRCECS